MGVIIVNLQDNSLGLRNGCCNKNNRSNNTDLSSAQDRDGNIPLHVCVQ